MLGKRVKIVEFASVAEVQKHSPSAYGVFGVVLNGKLLSYHYLTESQLAAAIETA